MSDSASDEAERRHSLREEAVEEAYQRLKIYHADWRKIVFFKGHQRRAGGYGTVQRAALYLSTYLPACLAWRLHGPPQIVAVKQISMSAPDDPDELKRALELLVWSGLKAHPGIARLIGFYADFERSEAWLLSSWEPHGNVTGCISGHQLGVSEKLSLVYDTIDALTFLHQLDPPVCHGDIKSANVLVYGDCRAVLCDSGLARFHEDSGFRRLETSNSTGFKGSIRWCSPELLDGGARTSSSDVYAWAWLVWEIMTGELPCQDAVADYAIIRRIFESPRLQVDGESRLSDYLQLGKLMTRCWVVVPNDGRFASTLRSPFWKSRSAWGRRCATASTVSRR